MTFTKEQLQQIEATAKEVLWPIVWTPLRARKHFEEKITPEVVLALARMALAGMEAEPVAWRIHTPSLDVTYVEMSIDAVGKIRDFCEKENAVVEITPLCTAPKPLTTSERAELENYRNAQPDVNYQHLSELYHAQEKRLFKLAQRIKGPAFDKYAYSPSQAIDVLESAVFGESEAACRAAMLQGKAPQQLGGPGGVHANVDHGHHVGAGDGSYGRAGDDLKARGMGGSGCDNTAPQQESE